MTDTPKRGLTEGDETGRFETRLDRVGLYSAVKASIPGGIAFAGGLAIFGGAIKVAADLEDMAVCHPIIRTLEAQTQAAEQGQDLGKPVEAGEVASCVKKYQGEKVVISDLCRKLHDKCKTVACIKETEDCISACK